MNASASSILLAPLSVLGSLVAIAACVPTGSAPPHDAGPLPEQESTFKPSIGVMTVPFEDDFERSDANDMLALPGDVSTAAPSIDAAVDAGRIVAVNEAGPDAFFTLVDLVDASSVDASADTVANIAERRRMANPLGPNWIAARTNAWRIENGRLCGEGARNRGVWLNRTLPVNARIEFDAIALTDNGDLKAEVWGDGRSYATSTSYTNATSYLTILGGWKNSMHVLARLNEHGTDRKEIRVDKESDDPREHAVVKDQLYRFKIERTDGKTIRWSVNDIEYFAWTDPEPLAGQQHDHMGFNVWESKVCFDNVKVTPL